MSVLEHLQWYNNGWTKRLCETGWRWSNNLTSPIILSQTIVNYGRLIAHYIPHVWPEILSHFTPSCGIGSSRMSISLRSRCWGLLKKCARASHFTPYDSFLWNMPKMLVYMFKAGFAVEDCFGRSTENHTKDHFVQIRPFLQKYGFRIIHSTWFKA